MTMTLTTLMMLAMTKNMMALGCGGDAGGDLGCRPRHYRCRAHV